MHIKNTIPAEFVFNSALMKNIENTLIKQHRTVNNERMITEIQHRLQTESNEILSDLYLQALDMRKRAARTVLTGMCYSVGSATRQGSSSLTRFIGQSAMTSRT